MTLPHFQKSLKAAAHIVLGLVAFLEGEESRYSSVHHAKSSPYGKMS